MNIENPKALHFIMQDDVFFLKEDREKYIKPALSAPIARIFEEEKSNATIPPEPKPGFTFTGKKGELLILVHYTDQEFIHETHLSALENILKRKNLAVADVAILNLATNTGNDYEALLEYFSPKKILILGERALPAGILPLTLNQPKQGGDKSILYSFSFDEMMDAPENKKIFWEQMKNF